MTSRRSITIQTATGTAMNSTSTPVEGDSYYGYSDGFHTMQVRYNNFVGRLRVQASLAIEPDEDDWFDLIPEDSMGGAWNSEGYIQFNSDLKGNLSEAYTFRGNFVWMRALMDRSYFVDGVTYDPGYGEIQQIIFSA